MKNGSALLRWAGMCCLFVLVSFLGFEAHGGRQTDETRADIITIDVLSRFGALEEPAVEFFHDKHTEALDKAGKDCTSCHLKDQDTGKTSIRFKRLADTDAKASKGDLKDIYHEQCIGCHTQTAAAGRESGPTAAECRQCHSSRPRAESSRQPVVVDRALHFRHADAYKDDPAKCGACHHSWDQAAGKTVPATEPEKVEGACGYCHGDQPASMPDDPEVVIRSERQAVHAECVSCHVQTAAKGRDTGPIRCAGCHAPMNQLDIQRKNLEKTEGKDLRIQRKQPDLVMVSTGLDPQPGTDGEKPRTMPPVAFDHTFHEQRVDTCRACHHQALQSCAVACHTVDGKGEKTSGVTLGQAMHLSGSELSCVGCHEQQQQKPQCAACHAQLPKGIRPGDASCGSCHKAPEGADTAGMTETAAPMVVTDGAGHATDPVAKAMADERARAKQLPAAEDIPEKVVIKTLADQYEAVELPHRKIVLALAEAVKDSRLAGAFHSDPTTLCQGCHHNSPAGLEPPPCASCHAQPFSEAAPNRPGLKAAYHAQCMGCHTAMGIDQPIPAKAFGMDKPTPAATDCAGCHKKK